MKRISLAIVRSNTFDILSEGPIMIDNNWNFEWENTK